MRYRSFSLFVFFFCSFYCTAQSLWEVRSYPDETGFQQRMAPMLPRIAAEGFAIRGMASSRCPDTGLPVKAWVLEGETVYSPYTGRAYRQGPTGYFGPKARNDKGEITAFGGDLLKYELPPATAQLLLEPANVEARAFLSIPGNLRQQYHFACNNWARFYPFLADEMGEEWKSGFHRAIADYEEARRPSDGTREWASLSYPHNLVGQPGTLLGGNTIDGGTENHKTMWRTACAVYSQHLPEDGLISGYPVGEAGEICFGFLLDFAKRILETGNGEYDSQIYYPYSIEGFFNLYDFSKNTESKALAKFMLDYYFAAAALKVVDGQIAGGMKRGYLPGDEADKMEKLFWGFFDNISRDMSEEATSVHHATTTYRPNELITRIARQEVPIPYEAHICRPFYHMDRFNAFQESFYRSESFGLGNVYMSIVDNPNQQMVWSLIAEGEDGPLGFTGGQPWALTTSGHSPYTQTVHSKGTLLLLSAPSQVAAEESTRFEVNPRRINPWHLPDSAQVERFEYANRRKYASEPLQEIQKPDMASAASLQAFWDNKKFSAASWLLIPRASGPLAVGDQWIIARANNTWVAVQPVGEGFFIIEVDADQLEEVKDKRWRSILQGYYVLVVKGQQSGYVLEGAEVADFPSQAALEEALLSQTRLDRSQLEKTLRLSYRSLAGDSIEMAYQPAGLKAMARINGNPLDFDNWAGSAVYESPYLKIKGGRMEVSDGKQGYSVHFERGQPVYQPLK